MNGFVASYLATQPPPADPVAVMGYYTAGAVPVFDFFARNFADLRSLVRRTADRHPTNRLMAMSGSSHILDNAVRAPARPAAGL